MSNCERNAIRVKPEILQNSHVLLFVLGVRVAAAGHVSVAIVALMGGWPFVTESIPGAFTLVTRVPTILLDLIHGRRFSIRSSFIRSRREKSHESFIYIQGRGGRQSGTPASKKLLFWENFQNFTVHPRTRVYCNIHRNEDFFQWEKLWGPGKCVESRLHIKTATILFLMFFTIQQWCSIQ